MWHDLLDIGFFRMDGACQYLVFVSIMNRGGVGDAWANLEYPPLCRGIQTGVFFHLRSRPHQAHIPFQDVPQLGQLIQFVFSKKTAYRCNSGIAISDGQQAFFIRAVAHASELVHLERHSKPADALLSI